jgi:hypothetical protein
MNYLLTEISDLYLWFIVYFVVLMSCVSLDIWFVGTFYCLHFSFHYIQLWQPRNIVKSLYPEDEYVVSFDTKEMLENTEGAIKNGQFRETGIIEYN